MDRNQTQLTTQGFTVKSRMKNYVVVGPSDAGAFQERAAKSAKFRKFFDRGDFPIALKHGLINSIAWRQEIETLDYNHYLPLFFDGLVETAHPYEFFACQGIHDMLQHAGPWIVPIVPQLIMPIKKALNTRNHQVMLNTLKALQQLMTCTDGVGKALVPFFKHILPVLNIFKNKKLTTGDAIDYSQQKRDIIGDVIEETLQLFERYGGEDAFESIRSMVPTYMSCMGDPLKSDIQRMQIELPSEESHITQHTTQHKPARVPPLCRRAGNLFKAKYPLITRNLLSGTEKHCYDSKANKQYLESIKHWTCLPPITKANQASYPSTVTDESSARYSTERPQSTKQYMEITRPLTCLPPISKTKQPNYPSKVTDVSSPRYGTERPQSTRQDMGITRPKTHLPSISKTSQSDCPSKVTGDSSLRCGTARPKSTRQVLQRTKPQPGYQVNIQVDLRKTCLPPIQPK